MKHLPIVLVVALAGCCMRPWSLAGAPRVAPDIQYREPSATHGNDVYVWNCYEGQHVVISQYSAELTCAQPKLETFACGTESPLEAQTPAASRAAVPPSMRWP